MRRFQHLDNLETERTSKEKARAIAGGAFNLACLALLGWLLGGAVSDLASKPAAPGAIQAALLAVVFTWWFALFIWQRPFGVFALASFAVFGLSVGFSYAGHA